MNFFSVRDEFQSNEKNNNSTLSASADKDRECKHYGYLKFRSCSNVRQYSNVRMFAYILMFGCSMFANVRLFECSNVR